MRPTDQPARRIIISARYQLEPSWPPGMWSLVDRRTRKSVTRTLDLGNGKTAQEPMGFFGADDARRWLAEQPGPVIACARGPLPPPR